ncbi:MAG: dTDP-4-dehydrorhamnose 3,5-epimerase [Ignavibacteriae bacterium]|nr:dTDP-4-dehydrorhamnose 3,5-epimerase [Ignavibacteriota bacterium]
MGLRLLSNELNGLIIFETEVHKDNRGFFMETFKADEFKALGLPSVFEQDNFSRSMAGVLRGMHFQWEPPQGKLIRVIAGTAFFAEIDIRKNSPTFGKWFGIELSDSNKKVMWVPPGFANGFVALSETVDVSYKCTALWNGKGEGCILWKDPEIEIKWPLGNPILSEKDKKGITLTDWQKKKEFDLFEYKNKS